MLQLTETVGPGFIGFSKKMHNRTEQELGSQGSLIPLNSTQSGKSTDSNSSASPSSAGPVLPKETLDEKKRRIYKWTHVEEVKLTMDFVKT